MLSPVRIVMLVSLALVGLATAACGDDQTNSPAPCPSYAKPVSPAISVGDAAPNSYLSSTVCSAYCTMSTTTSECQLSADAGAVLCGAGCF